MKHTGTMKDLVRDFVITIHRDVDPEDFWFQAEAQHDGATVCGEWKRSVGQAVESLLEKQKDLFDTFQ